MRVNFSYPTKTQIIEGVKRLKVVIEKYPSQKRDG